MMVASRLGALAVGAAAVVAATGFLRAAVIVDAGTPTLANTWTIRQAAGVHADTATPGAFYSDETNFSGYSVHGAYSTQKYTGVLADDINTNLSPGTTFLLGQFSSSVANGATVSQTISPYIRFYDTTGAGGGPGNLLGGVNFSGLSVPAGNVSGFYYNASSSAITLPSSFWAAEFFSTTVSGDARYVGVGVFNPVDVGSSNDEDFTSSTAATGSFSFVSANPAGTVNLSPFSGAPAANFAWEFNGAVTAVPEPASLSLISAAAMLGLSRRRRAI